MLHTLTRVMALTALVAGGAAVNAANQRGDTPLDAAVLDEGTTRYIASLLQLELDEEGLSDRKAAIAETLRQSGATAGKKPGLTRTLMEIPLFNHLWFLWFLWWLVLGYAAVSALGSRLPSVGLPAWLVVTPARYLWLVPLTMVPQIWMGEGGTTPLFGPDTSTGPLPVPHVLAYYAVFFGYGALFFGFDDRSRAVGRWWAPLLIAGVVVLPLGLGSMGDAESSLPHRTLSVFLQAAYPWLMTFGLMGLFRRYFPVEGPIMRYLSDSAYWLYLAHLPLIIAAQLLVRDWPVPAVVKFALIVTVTTSFLLASYQVMVRYTWLGRFLNGPRVRPEDTRTPTPATHSERAEMASVEADEMVSSGPFGAQQESIRREDERARGDGHRA